MQSSSLTLLRPLLHLTSIDSLAEKLFSNTAFPGTLVHTRALLSAFSMNEHVNHTRFGSFALRTLGLILPFVLFLVDLLGERLEGQPHGVQVVFIAVTVIRGREYLRVILRKRRHNRNVGLRVM